MGRIIANQYEELAQVGLGGQGMVFKVRHLERGTILALKALPFYLLDNEEYVARFEREVAVLQRLQHHNIVRVFASGHDEALRVRYFVMEYIEGKALKQYLKERGALPLAEVFDIVCQTARALVYAHRQVQPVIHRDVKPANIMIEEPSRRVVVLDFGIAKQLNAAEQFRTKTGAMLGTVKYCAPEQLKQLEITGSVDVYSLGMVMYEMLAGTQFFPQKDEYAVMAQVLDPIHENEPTLPTAVPAALVAILKRAIAKVPGDRYPRMIDFLAELESYRRTMHETPTILVNPAPEADLAVKQKPPPLAFISRNVPVSEQAQVKPQSQPKPPTPPVHRLVERVDAILPPRQDRSVQADPPKQKEPPVHNINVRLFTQDGKLNRAQFDADAFRALVATTAESNSLGDKHIAVFHLLISLTRGPYLKGFARYLTKRTNTDVDAKLKVVRALVRQAYHRPIVEDRLIVRELYKTDLETGVISLLQTAAQLAQQGEIEEPHLFAALLGNVPPELTPVLQESGLTLANLQQYKKETP